MIKTYSIVLINIITFLSVSLVQSDQCKSIVPLYDKISEETILQFTKKVPCAEKGKNEVKEYLHNIFKKQLPDSKLKNESLLLKSLRLISADFEYKTTLLGLYEEQIAGYYDPYEKSYSIANWIPKEMQLPVAIHELTHVLQDQNFDLLTFATPEMTTDQSLARAAVVEGDATYTMYNMIRKATGQKGLEESKEVDALVSSIESQSSNSIGPKKIPDFLKRMIIFPYSNGLRYISSKKILSKENTSESIFKNPPNYTSEILYPDDTSIAETIVQKSCPNKPKMRKVHEDRLGEFFYETNIIKKSNNSNNRAWNGDIACIFEDPNDSRKLAYFASDWLDKDRHESALGFFNSLPNSKIINDKFPAIEVEIRVLKKQ